MIVPAHLLPKSLPGEAPHAVDAGWLAGDIPLGPIFMPMEGTSKFERICAWGAIAAIAGLCTASPASAETLRFKFRTAADAAGWKPASDIAWEVSKKGYRPLQREGAYPISLLQKPVFTNADATIDISDLKPGSFGGVLIRAKTTETTVSGYLAILANEAGASGFVELDKLTEVPFDGMGGGDVDIVCQKNVPLTGGRLTISAQGSKIKVLYNDEVVCALNDSSFKKGRIGLFTNFPPDKFPAFKSVFVEY
jgi:hypothetical protein